MFRCKTIFLLILACLFIPHLVWAAPDPAGSAALKVRSHQDSEKLRIVIDMAKGTEYSAVLTDEPRQLKVQLAQTVNQSGQSHWIYVHPAVASLRLQESKGSLTAVIDLKQHVEYKVFSLQKPDRMVIDIFSAKQKPETVAVAPGLTYTALTRKGSAGLAKIHVLTMSPRQGLQLVPVLSNGAIKGLDTVSAMAHQSRSVAAVNGSYFAPSGEVIGLMKVNGEIVSTPAVARTALGILPDQTVLMDQVKYQGYAELPGGVKAVISGVNRQRGENEMVLYNSWYDRATGTNDFGAEYIIREGKVQAVTTANAPIGPDTTVLSVHGEAQKKLARLKPGDEVKITHSLGAKWDQTVHALGAGPMLVKEGSVFLTTKLEDFGSDIAGGRAPRTAVGITGEGKILLVAVDGRRSDSAGMSLLELALLMQELGALDAMNLDGGGSTAMVIHDKVVNNPSGGGERKVGNALTVVAAGLANSNK